MRVDKPKDCLDDLCVLKIRGKIHIFLLQSLVAVLFAPVADGADYEAEPINYWTHRSNDVIAQLQRKIESGETSLRGKSPQVVLLKLLDYLEIPIESQMLVYSKTSAQNSRISPPRPRAIYFSDNAYVGWVQGGSIEVICFDEHLGAVFYFIDIRKAEMNRGEPVFDRPKSCMTCHEGATRQDIPGGLVRSVFPSETGMPIFAAGTHAVDDSTPIKNRWGGWYVTGNPGQLSHMGNSIAHEEGNQFVLKPIAKSGIKLKTLDGVINAKPYLAGGSSDIVALMVFEHQVRMHNLIVSSSVMAREVEYRYKSMRRELGDPIPEEPEGSWKVVVESRAQKIVQGLLFCDEHRMEEDGVDGGEDFQDAFLENCRPSKSGRSLKDFRLYKRIFKHRCSYVIYSDVFDWMPAELKAEVYLQLFDALSKPNGTRASSHLSATERERILEIIRETKPDLPDYWFST